MSSTSPSTSPSLSGGPSAAASSNNGPPTASPYLFVAMVRWDNEEALAVADPDRALAHVKWRLEDSWHLFDGSHHYKHQNLPSDQARIYLSGRVGDADAGMVFKDGRLQSEIWEEDVGFLKRAARVVVVGDKGWTTNIKVLIHLLENTTADIVWVRGHKIHEEPDDSDMDDSDMEPSELEDSNSEGDDSEDSVSDNGSDETDELEDGEEKSPRDGSKAREEVEGCHEWEGSIDELEVSIGTKSKDTVGPEAVDELEDSSEAGIMGDVGPIDESASNQKVQRSCPLESAEEGDEDVGESEELHDYDLSDDELEISDDNSELSTDDDEHNQPRHWSDFRERDDPAYKVFRAQELLAIVKGEHPSSEAALPYLEAGDVDRFLDLVGSTGTGGPSVELSVPAPVLAPRQSDRHLAGYFVSQVVNEDASDGGEDGGEDDGGDDDGGDGDGENEIE